MLALLIQAALPTDPPLRIDLLSVTQHCPDASAGGDVVVCGRPADRRLHPVEPPARPVTGPPLTLHIPGGGTANLHAIQTTQSSGAIGRGVAATLRIPLGKGRK